MDSNGPYKRPPFIGGRLHGGASACKAPASASEFDSRPTDHCLRSEAAITRDF